MAEDINTQSPAEVKTTNVEVELSVEMTTNGQVYGPGIVRVPAEIASDLQRRQREYDAVERERLISRTITVNGGSLDAGGK